MDNLLNVDLNDLVSKEINEKIAYLEKERQEYRDELYKVNNELTQAKEKLTKLDNFSFLIEGIKEQFNSISLTEEENEQYIHASYVLQMKRIGFVFKLIKHYFGLEPTYGCISNTSRDSFEIATEVWLNFYKNKDKVKIILDILDIEINSIFYAQMPYRYSKEKIIEFINNMHDMVNSNYFGHNYCEWLRYDKFSGYTPYQLLFQNPHMLDDEIFELIIEKLKKADTFSKSNYLYELYKYQQLSIEQIQKMGRTLISKKSFKNDSIESFVKIKMNKFDDETLDYLHELITTDNQYKLFHWQNFPTKYQYKFLLDKPFEHVNKWINHCSCNWSIEEKEQFMKLYFETKNND